MSLRIKLTRNGTNSKFWCTKTFACSSRILMTSQVVWDVTLWKYQISQLPMLLLLLLILILLLLSTAATFLCCQNHCYARDYSTTPCDTQGYIQNTCSVTFGQERIRRHLVCSDQSVWLHIQGSTLPNVTQQGVMAAGAGTSGFAQCTHCLLIVKRQNFTVT